MSSFYKMDPAAWDFGTTDLTLEQEAAYLRIVNAIHKHDQPVPNNDHVLAGLFRCSTRKARSLLNALIEAGKVEVEDGKITNDRAISDVVHRGFVSGSRAESGAKGGRTRAENARKSLKNNKPTQANASTRIEENRIEDSVDDDARVREPDPPSPDPTFRERILAAIGVDPRTGLTGHGGAVLGNRHDMELAGRWKSELGLSEDAIVAVIAETMATKPDGQPPNSFKYFNRAMQREAARRDEPPLTPEESHGRQAPARNSREAAADDAFARRIHAAARARSPSREDFGFG